MKREKVNRWYITIEKEVPSIIFEKPVIRVRIMDLFESSKELIDKRIHEITSFLNMEPCYELSHDFIYDLFKAYFCQQVANEAVKMAFMEQDNYDILKNIISLLTKSQLKAAVMGEPMIEAFSRAIRIIPSDSPSAATLNGNKILLLHKKFLSH